VSHVGWVGEGWVREALAQPWKGVVLPYKGSPQRRSAEPRGDARQMSDRLGSPPTSPSEPSWPLESPLAWEIRTKVGLLCVGSSEFWTALQAATGLPAA
jgi:hypothetical protein